MDALTRAFHTRALGLLSEAKHTVSVALTGPYHSHTVSRSSQLLRATKFTPSTYSPSNI